jgi:hypothetical protein
VFISSSFSVWSAASQPRARLEQADPVDPALGRRHMFLEAPAQAAVEVELPVQLGLVSRLRVSA